MKLLFVRVRSFVLPNVLSWRLRLWGLGEASDAEEQEDSFLGEEPGRSGVLRYEWPRDPPARPELRRAEGSRGGPPKGVLLGSPRLPSARLGPRGAPAGPVGIHIWAAAPACLWGHEVDAQAARVAPSEGRHPRSAGI